MSTEFNEEVKGRPIGVPSWLLPMLLLLLGALFVWYFLKGCGNVPATTPVVDTVVQVKTDTITLAAPVYKIKLPDGTEIEGVKGGIEDLLVAFLMDSTAKGGKDNWFDFNDLNFKTGTAEILPESKKQLDNIVAILKAFPKVKVKVGGYTDKVGDEGFNKKLSKDRAEAVSTALKDSGVGAQLTGAEGYGSQFAKYPADAPETDRVKDRRVSLSVREK